MSRRNPYVGDRLLTVVEVAALMRVSNMTVYRLIKSGNLAAIRVGKNYRIRESDVDSYLSDRAVRITGECTLCRSEPHFPHNAWPPALR